MSRCLRTLWILLVTAAATSSLGCKDCAIIPCPYPGFDQNTCSCMKSDGFFQPADAGADGDAEGQ